MFRTWISLFSLAERSWPICQTAARFLGGVVFPVGQLDHLGFPLVPFLVDRWPCLQHVQQTVGRLGTGVAFVAERLQLRVSFLPHDVRSPSLSIITRRFRRKALY